MIEVRDLHKSYGNSIAVDGVTFKVEPGSVTGFLGPNGAGKSTTMRMILGLDRPDSGTILVDGKNFVESPAPLTMIGSLLDGKYVHPNRSARAHLKQLALSNGIPMTRVDEVLHLTGIESVAKRPFKTFSLGMGQRLGMAAALLGDPSNLLFDEPVNGLDPEGVKWVREMCRHLADNGHTVFVSSHLMSEMSQMADHVIVIGRGRILAQGSVKEITSSNGKETVRVASQHIDALAQLLHERGATVTPIDPHTATVSGVSARGIGEICAAQGFILDELTPMKVSLEEAFFALTSDSVAYKATIDDASVVAGAAAPGGIR